MIFFPIISSQARTVDVIVKSIKDVCQSPAEKGAHWDIKIQGSGKAKIKFIGSLSGKVEFSEAEWQGVQRVLREHQKDDNKNYRDCVTKLTPTFLDKFIPNTPISELSIPIEEVVILGKEKGIFFVPVISTNLEGYDPAWSSDGKIVYMTDSLSVNKGTDIFVSNNFGKSSKIVLTTSYKAYFPRFSPDNRFISFITDTNVDSCYYSGFGVGHLNVYDIKTNMMHQVTSKRQRISFSKGNQVDYDWNPIKNKVTFILVDISDKDRNSILCDNNENSISDVNNDFYIAVYDASTSSIEKYYKNNGWWYEQHPQWSPNGKNIGFVAGGGGLGEAYSLDLETNNIDRIGNININGYFLWETNNKIIFSAGGAGAYRIATYDIDNKKLGYISKYKYYFDPVISKNKKILIYHNLVEETIGYYRNDFYVHYLNTMKRRKIYELPPHAPYNRDLLVQMSPSGKRAIFSYKSEIVILDLSIG